MITLVKFKAQKNFFFCCYDKGRVMKNVKIKFEKSLSLTSKKIWFIKSNVRSEFSYCFKNKISYISLHIIEENNKKKNDQVSSQKPAAIWEDKIRVRVYSKDWTCKKII